MKLLKEPERTVVPDTSPPLIIVMTDPDAQQLISRLGNIPINQPSPYPYKTIPPDSHLQKAIRAEQDYLYETLGNFLSATKTFLTAMFRWLMWRIVMPVTVIGIMLSALL